MRIGKISVTEGICMNARIYFQATCFFTPCSVALSATEILIELFEVSSVGASGVDAVGKSKRGKAR